MSYLPIRNRSRRICRIACDIRATLALARLREITTRQTAVYIAIVELGLPKKSVIRQAYKGSGGYSPAGRRALARIEDARDCFSTDAAITDLARLAA